MITLRYSTVNVTLFPQCLSLIGSHRLLRTGMYEIDYESPRPRARFRLQQHHGSLRFSSSLLNFVLACLFRADVYSSVDILRF